MSKDIREYLHYFIGQQCRMTKPTYHAVHELRLSADTDFILTGKLCHYFSDGTTKAEVKPILRKLESMTDAEAIEIYNIRGGQSLTDESKAFQIKEQLCGYRFYSGVTNLSGNAWAEIFHYLLSRGFWIFDKSFFDDGLILEKKQ